MNDFLGKLGEWIKGLLGLVFLIYLLMEFPKILFGIIILSIIYSSLLCGKKDKENKALIEAQEKRLKNSVNFWHNKYINIARSI